MKSLIVPEGYTTLPDDSGECYRCAFCTIEGVGEDSDLGCSHPTPANTGCCDYDVVFVKEK